jgi:hypothetical protein
MSSCNEIKRHNSRKMDKLKKEKAVNFVEEAELNFRHKAEVLLCIAISARIMDTKYRDLHNWELGEKSTLNVVSCLFMTMLKMVLLINASISA